MVILCYFVNFGICDAIVESTKLIKLDINALEEHIDDQKKTKRKVSKIVLTSSSEDESLLM
jgi:hypothetical protein